MAQAQILHLLSTARLQAMKANFEILQWTQFSNHP